MLCHPRAAHMIHTHTHTHITFEFSFVNQRVVLRCKHKHIHTFQCRSIVGFYVENSHWIFDFNFNISLSAYMNLMGCENGHDLLTGVVVRPTSHSLRHSLSRIQIEYNCSIIYLYEHFDVTRHTAETRGPPYAIVSRPRNKCAGLSNRFTYAKFCSLENRSIASQTRECECASCTVHLAGW